MTRRAVSEMSPWTTWLVTGSATVRIDWKRTVPTITCRTVALDTVAPPIRRHATAGKAMESGGVESWTNPYDWAKTTIPSAPSAVERIAAWVRVAVYEIPAARAKRGFARAAEIVIPHRVRKKSAISAQNPAKSRRVPVGTVTPRT